MNYYECYVYGNLKNDVLIAILMQWPFESFMEEEEGVKAYLPELEYSESLKSGIEQSLRAKGLAVKWEYIPEQNWNESWESNFNPVSVASFCHVRASFHPGATGFQHEVIINPKMAFGTAHHETTHMMIEMMEKINFSGKSVLDYGTGTGILAILAKMLGAERVDAIDNDKYAVENAKENIEINKQTGISLSLQTLDDKLMDNNYQIILANINKNVLWESIISLQSMISKEGILVISGVLDDKKADLMEKFEKFGFKQKEVKKMGDWSCVKFSFQIS